MHRKNIEVNVDCIPKALTYLIHRHVFVSKQCLCSWVTRDRLQYKCSHKAAVIWVKCKIPVLTVHVSAFQLLAFLDYSEC